MDSNTSTTDKAPSPRPVDQATTPWRFPTGECAFLASDWRAFIPAAIDATLVLGAGLVQYLTVMASPYGTQPQALAGRPGHVRAHRHLGGVPDRTSPCCTEHQRQEHPPYRRFRISIRKDAAVSGLARDPAALEASHGRTNEAHKYVDPMPVAPEKSMDTYHPMVPSQFKDGSWGIQARLWKIILAWAIALGVVFSLSAALLGETLRHSWEIAGSFILFAPLFAWFSGMCCPRGYTLGTLLAGTRIVRFRNGKAPGPWRGGWVMFYRIVLAVTAPFFIFFGMLDGSSTSRDMMRAFHVSIDMRRTGMLDKD